MGTGEYASTKCLSEDEETCFTRNLSKTFNGIPTTAADEAPRVYQISSKLLHQSKSPPLCHTQCHSANHCRELSVEEISARPARTWKHLSFLRSSSTWSFPRVITA